MKFTANKKDLLRVIGRAKDVADKKSTMPILANVLISAESDSVRVSATDLAVSLTGVCAASTLKPGSVAVSAGDVAQRVAAMPDGDVMLSFDSTKGELTIAAKSSARRFMLPALDGAEFPEIARPVDGECAMVPALTLAKLLAMTHFAISTDETRLHLSAALFEPLDTRLRVVATDGHRLSLAESDAPEVKASPSFLVPGKAVRGLRALCDESLSRSDDESVSIQQAGPMVHFQLSGYQFSAKIADASFPPYRQVIPDKHDNETTVSRPAFLGMLKAVSLSASDRTGGVKVSAEKSKLRVSSESPESGAGSDECAAEHKGGAVEFGANAKYIIDVLGALSSDQVVIETSKEDLTPIVIRANESTDYTAVIMPMRV